MLVELCCLLHCFVHIILLKGNTFNWTCAEENKICNKLESTSGPGIVDIDLNLKDTQFCGTYAPEIYNNIRVKEVSAEIVILIDGIINFHSLITVHA